MIDLNTIRHIYFIGIGGIGMSALARYFLFQGKKVSGYDRTQSTLTLQMEKEGISIHYTDDPGLAPKEAELVIYTPAIPADHLELGWYRQHNYPVVKRSDALGAITQHTFNICVAGTHGKTTTSAMTETTSAMTAHILRHSGYGCNAFLGGIAANYNSNFWSSERAVCVVEADEYDRSFLKLSPDIAVITAMDADHLDIYGTERSMQDSFIEFSGRIKPEGTLFVKAGLSRSDEFRAGKKTTYHFSDDTADIYAKNLKTVNGHYRFDAVVKGERIDGLTLNMGGAHNVENALASIGIARLLNIDAGLIREAVAAFKGVKRRFEYLVKTDKLAYIDDYAHHPEELNTLISSAKALFGEMRCTVIFQPHLYSRTRDLAEQFAESLDKADEVILLPIYPARELPIEGVSSEMIASRMKNRQCRVLDKNELLDDLGRSAAQPGKGRLIITAGAGDIDRLTDPIRTLLNAKQPMRLEEK